MTPRKSVKQYITEAVLAEIPKHLFNDSDLDIEQLIFKWWLTGRQEGLRLREEGLAAFLLAEIEYYEYDLLAPAGRWHEYLLELNKKIKCPYYIDANRKHPTSELNDKPRIKLFDSKIAMMVGLYGTIPNYLESIKVKR
jgi:hypothetical protein